jgi:hypothetical protein
MLREQHYNGITAASPGRTNQRIHHDKRAYKGRNVVERRYCDSTIAGALSRATTAPSH